MAAPLKDYRKLVQAIIFSRDVSLDVKVELWQRFAEYELCAADESDNDDTPVSVAGSGDDGKVDDVAGASEVETISSDSSRGDERDDSSAPVEAESITTISSNTSRNSSEGHESDDCSTPTEEPETTSTTTSGSEPESTPTTSSNTSEGHANDGHADDHHSRGDVEDWRAALAERERLLAAREAFVAARAEALWANARVLAGLLKRGFGGVGGRRGRGKRVRRG